MNPEYPNFFTNIESEPKKPVVVNVPHSGLRVPDDVAATIALPLSVLSRDADFAVNQLFEDAPRLGAALMQTSISRFVCDLNRHPEDFQSALQNPTGPHPEISYGRRGLIWMETTSGEVVVPRPLTAEELDRRRAYYLPYHDQLARLLRERRQRFGFAILIDGHSMPSRGARGHTDPGSERADFVLGDNAGRSCDEILVAAVEATLLRLGYSVVRNKPYRGGYNTRFYGVPSEGVHALQIEINRKLYMDETTTALLPKGSASVRAAMIDVVKTVLGLSL